MQDSSKYYTTPFFNHLINYYNMHTFIELSITQSIACIVLIECSLPKWCAKVTTCTIETLFWVWGGIRRGLNLNWTQRQPANWRYYIKIIIIITHLHDEKEWPKHSIVAQRGNKKKYSIKTVNWNRNGNCNWNKPEYLYCSIIYISFIQWYYGGEMLLVIIEYFFLICVRTMSFGYRNM